MIDRDINRYVDNFVFFVKSENKFKEIKKGLIRLCKTFIMSLKLLINNASNNPSVAKGI